LIDSSLCGSWPGQVQVSRWLLRLSKLKLEADVTDSRA
jgi:hypothetical protein